MMTMTSKSSWTDEVLEMLIEDNKAGFSCSQIAARINARSGFKFSRNAVIGKLHRMGIVSGVVGRTRVQRKPKRLEHRGAAALQNRGKTGASIMKNSAAVLKDVVWIEKLDPATNVDLLALNDGLCKWPVSDELYCGAAVMLKRKPYCSIHSAMSGDKGRNKIADENEIKRKSLPSRGRWF